MYIKQSIPKNFLEVNCKEAAAGDTVRTLAMAYVKTRSCLRAYQALIEGVIKNYSDEGGRLDGNGTRSNQAPQ